MSRRDQDWRHLGSVTVVEVVCIVRPDQSILSESLMMIHIIAGGAARTVLSQFGRVNHKDLAHVIEK